MKIHKLEIIVADINMTDLSMDDVISTLENSFEGIVQIVKRETKDDKKEWNDNSPLNFSARKADNYFKSL